MSSRRSCTCNRLLTPEFKIVTTNEKLVPEAPDPAGVTSSEDQHPKAAIEVVGLEMGYGSYILMRDINFKVAPGEIMVRTAAPASG